MGLDATPSPIRYGTPAYERLSAALEAIYEERERQDGIRGEQNHPSGTGSETQKQASVEMQAAVDAAAENGELTWAGILGEEVAEAFAEDDPLALREELIQAAAVCVAWVDYLDRWAT